MLAVETPAPVRQPAEPPARQAPARKNSFRLEVEDVEDDGDEPEDDAILSRFSGKVSRLMARRDEDFDDDDGDDEDEDGGEAPLAPGRTIFSSKFGEMRFGEGFSLTQEEKGSGGRADRKGRR